MPHISPSFRICLLLKTRIGEVFALLVAFGAPFSFGLTPSYYWHRCILPFRVFLLDESKAVLVLESILGLE